MISVIVPVYNARKYLTECVESIRAQTYRDLEILLIDDGSTDGSGELCDEFAQQDARVRVIHQANGGESEARNAGFAAFRGEYAACVDADDRIDPQMLEMLLGAMNRQHADIVIAGMALYSGLKTIKTFVPPRRVLAAKEATRLILQTPGYMNSLGNKLFRRELLFGFQSKSYASAGDLAVTYQAIHRAQRIALIPNILYRYRIHSDSAINKPFQTKRLDSLRSFDDMAVDIRAWYPDLENQLRVCEATFALALLRRVAAARPRHPQEEKLLAQRARRTHNALFKVRPFPKKVWLMDLAFRLGPWVYRPVYAWYEQANARRMKE